MKVYGTKICIECRNYKAIQRKRGFDAEFIDITENTDNLKEFLKLRDSENLFETIKEKGGIGIPFFVNENGAMTLDVDEALSWIGEGPVQDSEIEEKE